MSRNAPRLQVRMLASLAVLLLLAGVLLGRLGQMQLTDHEEGAGVNAPVTASVPLPALRGRILDRHSRPIVDNAVRTDVTIERSALADAPDGGRATVRRIAQALDLPFARLWGRTTLCGAPGAADPPLCWPGSPLVPVPLVVDADPARAAALAERPEHYPGVVVTTQPVRSYLGPKRGGAAQTTGYLARPSAETVAESDGQITGEGLVGAAGLELQYDDLLRGRAGQRTVRVDARGVAVDEVDRTDPVPGKDLVTTLDLRIQRATQEALADGVRAARERGHTADTAAALVLDLRDGGVLASASLPTYDPSVWSRGVTQEQYDRLTKGADSPLIDRVTGVAQPPASTFKVVSLPGAVASGVDLDQEVNCTSSHRIGNRTFHNYQSRAYGWISWRRAITVSCDTVFYRVAEAVWRAQGGLDAQDDGGDPLIGTARLLGLGSPTGIDLPTESAGRIPDREWKRQWWESTKEETCRRAETGYPDMTDRADARYLKALARENCESGYLFRPGDEANLSIGQGDVTATLLQMASVFGAIAQEGRVAKPHLGRAEVTAEGTRTHLAVGDVDSIDLPGRSGDLLRRALQDVVAQPDGTAHSAFADFPLKRWPVAGKTGTAEVHGQEDTAWFLSYAPVQDPRYVVGVVVSQGGTGGATSAPIARQIHEELAEDTP
ncbi:penicillin-binding transpeptidase domain-containing protein [Janibacter cremeus]|uniref:Penicillin-binding protein 2 n=1 Tax=Janibacter cremeus TaxID=1285192 RepID=A0A852VXD0_9MICO|nr:penicillin-binding transpeptidase domain-containing protein [Janibacter cremeus]NYF99313.1 penicillin-binding protein 2 [Janibacter cremeus]